METLSYGDLVDLWESRNDLGKHHIGYSASLDLSTLSIYGAQGLEECIIISLEIVFLSYQERALFSMTPTLQNDQVSIEGLLSFLGGEYNESNESLSVNENDVANLPN